MPEIIYRKGPKYYFGTYSTWKDALKVAKMYKRINKSTYFILAVGNTWTGTKKYKLYLSRAMSFGG